MLEHSKQELVVFKTELESNMLKIFKVGLVSTYHVSLDVNFISTSMLCEPSHIAHVRRVSVLIRPEN